ncbi:hypothetical protein GGI25_004501 [Coemansia spiralis]|uniref:Uncharacterized protein n=2 Tax=Coemansia TaxID=4863 RepID=A0A9W8KWL8_9FUNG|nr:hypothetical protein EDC05_005822 [Coemansia umbellata]KAJ2619302.1 hypothetical protein GGI26_005947 [Coemansia sp. RSA 1358]KAJ2674016.1 hypothetical protein GGI25_004501 [Coemansia spiralis]
MTQSSTTTTARALRVVGATPSVSLASVPPLVTSGKLYRGVTRSLVPMTLTPMENVLAEYASDGSDSTAGLEDYFATWEGLGKNGTNFQQAQDTVNDGLYYNPAQAVAKQLGLNLDISQDQLYNTGIRQGTGDGSDGMLTLISDTNKEFTSDTLGNSGNTLTINGY